MPRPIEAGGLIALALCALAGCQGDPGPPSAPKRDASKSEPPAAPPPSTKPSSEPIEHRAESGGATDVLRHYYDLIDKRHYAQALALREAGGTDAREFAAHFEGFQSQKVTIGVPSEPVRAGDWLYVEVPVQTYGMMKNGMPFGSAGTVTLRRKVTDGHWRIYTK